MLNYVLLIGRVARLEKSKKSKTTGRRTPLLVNIVIPDPNHPIDYCIPAKTWLEGMYEELSHLKVNKIPVIALCRISAKYYYKKDKTAGGFSYNVVIEKIGFLGENGQPSASKKLPEELTNKCWELFKQIENSPNINWWGSDTWKHHKRISKPKKS